MPVATLHALLDLVLPAACAGCGTEDSSWCQTCAATLAGRPWATTPDPCPPGFPPTWAVAAYDGPVRAAAVAHKERGVRAVRAPLAAALSGSVAAALADRSGGLLHPRVVLVPAPSRGAAVRSRGDDPTLGLARSAGRG